MNELLDISLGLPLSNKRVRTILVGVVLSGGKFGAFRPEGRRFESHYICHIGTLSKYLPVANSDTISTLLVGSASERFMLWEALYKWINTIQYNSSRDNFDSIESSRENALYKSKIISIILVDNLTIRIYSSWLVTTTLLDRDRSHRNDA